MGFAKSRMTDWGTAAPRQHAREVGAAVFPRVHSFSTSHAQGAFNIVNIVEVANILSAASAATHN